MLLVIILALTECTCLAHRSIRNVSYKIKLENSYCIYIFIQPFRHEQDETQVFFFFVFFNYNWFLIQSFPTVDWLLLPSNPPPESFVYGLNIWFDYVTEMFV